MRTITLASQKGGVGKSSLAVHLACAAQGRVALIDTDPQGSLAAWAHVRQSNTPAVGSVEPRHLRNALTAAREDGFDVAIVDTAPTRGSDVPAAAHLADLVLVPVRPAAFDLAAALTTVQQTGGWAVLNQCPPRRGFGEPTAVRDARAFLGAPTAPVTVTERSPFQHALADGAGITEYAPSSKAANEINMLWDWLNGPV